MFVLGEFLNDCSRTGSLSQKIKGGSDTKL